MRLNLDLTPREEISVHFNAAYSDHTLSITHTGNSAMALPFNAFRQPNNSFGSSDPKVLSQLLDAEVGQENQHFTTGLTLRWTPTSVLTQELTVGLDRSAGLSSTLSWGAQSIATEDDKVDAFGTGFPGPGRHTLSSTADRFLFGSESRIVTAGFFLQNLIGLGDRLFLTTGAQVDGSSTFGQDLGLQVYPKVSASYVISDEGFWDDTWGTAKLRAALGYAGRAPGAFDAVRSWSPFSFGGQPAYAPGNVGNPELGPERTRELELGFDAAWLDGRLNAELTYYDQVTTDALFPIAQIPSLGFVGTQLENVGEITNRGLEFTLGAQLYQGVEFGWHAGLGVTTNRSEVRKIGNTSSYNIEVGQPAPVIRGTLVENKREFTDPVLELDHFFGPNQPTLIVSIDTDLDLPYGLRLTARGEYQGGHYITDSASEFMVDRGSGAPACDAAYKHVPFDDYPNGDLSQINALDRARCYKENLRSGLWVYPADFFKLREVTLVAPIGLIAPGARSATLSLSLRNAFRWTNGEFPAFDPEMVSSRSNTGALTSGITEHAPAPARLTASVRIVF